MLVDYALPGKRYSSVLIDNYKGARAATAHLIETGHSKIAFIGGDPDFPEDAGFALKRWVNVRYDNNARRDMRPKHIVSAVGKLERSGMVLVNELVILNQWR